MRVKDTVIFAGDQTLKNRHNEAINQLANEKKESKSIFAGGLNKALDPITGKRKEAQQRAMKIVGDAWEGEQQVSKQISESKARIAEYQRAMSENSKKLDEIEESRIALRKNYGIEEDSQEEQDLQLLVKRIDANKPGSKVRLTDEDREQLARIDEGELTEYQRHSLEIKAGGAPYEQEIVEEDQGINRENAVISAIRNEMLKSQNMVKAGKSADEIMKAASDEIQGMLIQEAKEHVDEKQEEELEAAKKKAEKKEEEEEKAEKLEENKSEQEKVRDNQEQAADSSESLVELGSTVKEVQKEVKKILDEMKLIEEEIKGAVVDTLN